MPERRERTVAEREAARREREARRAAAGRPVALEPQDAAGIKLSPPPVGAPPPQSQPSDGPPPSSDGDQHLGAVTAARDDADDDEAPTRLREPPAPRRRAPARPTSSRGRAAKLVRRAVAVAALLVAFAVVWFLAELFQPFHGAGHGTVLVRIPSQESASAVGDLLAREGVISSSFFFELRATIEGDRGSIRSGTFRMPLGISYTRALAILTTPPPARPVTEVTITEGLSRRQIDRLLRSQHVAGSYWAQTRHSKLLDPVKYGAPRDTPSLEGFLFPNTYQLYKPVRISDLVADQLETFKNEIRTVNMGFARARHLTPYDVLIIASIVQGEAQTGRDFRLVASVIDNRLARGMALGSDATTRYAVDNYTKPLTTAQIDSPSPWNTRVHTGLPPTPINSPGLAAIDAAAHPPATNYLYFIVKPCGNGTLEYASTYQQFLAEDAAYQQAAAKRGGNSPEFCSAKKR